MKHVKKENKLGKPLALLLSICMMAGTLNFGALMSSAAENSAGSTSQVETSSETPEGEDLYSEESAPVEKTPESQDDVDSLDETDQPQETPSIEEPTPAPDDSGEIFDAVEEGTPAPAGGFSPARATLTDIEIDNLKYTLDDTTLAATATGVVTIPGGNIIIPDTVAYSGQTYNVTSVGEKAFYMKTYSTITIGANVESIGANAFGTSLDKVTKIEFMGDKCQTIASDAFDWMTFSSSTFQLIVHGSQGCMDNVLSGVADLKDKTVEYIVPDDTPAEDDSGDLQTKIDSASPGTETEIIIGESLILGKTVTIPGGKNIVLKDDGEHRTITSGKQQQNAQELFIVESGATLTFDGNLSFVGGEVTSSQKGNIVHINKGGKFFLKSGSLTRDKDKKISNQNQSAAVLADKGSTFEMSGGSISHFNFENGNLVAPVIVESEATFNMSGGEIRNNAYRSDYHTIGAGGVLVYTWNGDPTANMTISGEAKITENVSDVGGGGIYLIGNTSVIMNGGTISFNRASGSHGGGVCIAGKDGGANSEDDICKFEMNGGKISNNRSVNTGGGIYVNSDYVTLKGGEISDNTAASHGGGVYVSQVPYTLHLYDALITGNTAATMGGGLWFCPTGKAALYVTNGAAVFGNSAGDEKHNGAGDDFVSLDRDEGSITLADRMLGGGEVAWYDDGGVISGDNSDILGNVIGEVDPFRPRFDPENPGEQIHVSASSETHALKAVTTQDATKRAEESAKLIIKGNSAARGGGIGSNGNVTIGTPSGVLRISKTVNVGMDRYKLWTFKILVGNTTGPHFAQLWEMRENGEYKKSLFTGKQGSLEYENGTSSVEFQDGKAEIQLRHGQELRIFDLPTTLYTVWEVEANQDGYRTSGRIMGMIVPETDTESDAKAAFSNVRAALDSFAYAGEENDDLSSRTKWVMEDPDATITDEVYLAGLQPNEEYELRSVILNDTYDLGFPIPALFNGCTMEENYHEHNDLGRLAEELVMEVFSAWGIPYPGYEKQETASAVSSEDPQSRDEDWKPDGKWFSLPAQIDEEKVDAILTNPKYAEVLKLIQYKKTSFTPETEDWTESVVFEHVNTINKGGQDLRVFQILSKDSEIIATELVASYERETVYVKKAEINTYAAVDGMHEVMPEKEVQIKDTVSYKNLSVGKKYRLEGKLILKSTGEPLLQDGKEVKTSVSFTPERSDGTVEQTFNLDASDLDGDAVVVFETLYREDYVITKHEDMDDEKQTVSFVKDAPTPTHPSTHFPPPWWPWPDHTTPTTTPTATPDSGSIPKTGDETPIGLIAALAIASAVGLVGTTVLFAARRKKKSGKQPPAE